MKATGADCEHCPLADRPFVPPHGPTGSVKFAVVGEAPGYNEAKEGKPFVGASGKLLNAILAQHGIERKDVWATNAVLCHPAQNETPNAAAIKACRPRLVEELRSKTPGVVIALGATAAKSLRRENASITHLRQQPAEYNAELDAKLVCTYHPAAALRSPDYYPSILRDVARSARPTVVWEYTKFKVVDDIIPALDTLKAQHEHAHNNTLVADIERDYEHGTYEDKSDPKFLCWAISHEPGKAVVYTERIVNHPLFREAVRRSFESGIEWGWQSGKFDIQWLWSSGIKNARVDRDSMLAHYATDERKGTHDLEQMAVELLEAPHYKSDTRDYLPFPGASLRHLPPHILHQYNAADADVTHRLLAKLEPEARADDTYKVYRDLMIPAANTLARVEYSGINIDTELLVQMQEQFGESINIAEVELEQWVKNPRSWQQILLALKEMGIRVENTRKETLRDVDSEFTDKLLKYRKMQKLLGTYIKGLLKRTVDGRIYTHFNQQTTETGRLSSSDPNMQNIPRDKEVGLRNAIVARPGRLLVEADYSAIELRLMAEFSNDDYLLGVFHEGRNVHKETALGLFGPNYTDQQYVWTKNVRFASIYKGTADFVAHLYDIPVASVKAVQRAMHRQSPAIRRFWAETEGLLRTQQYLRSYFGRLRRFWLVTEDNFYDLAKEAINFRVSSPATDLTLSALIRLEPMLRDVATPIITVHDSLVFDTIEEAVPDVVATMRRVMEDTPFGVPTPVEVKVGPRWGSMKEV